MSLFFLLEGRRSERQVYRRWIQHGFPGYEEVHRVDALTEDRFLLRTGGGYPNLLEILRQSIHELSQRQTVLQRFFVCMDAEECSYDERYEELSRATQELSPPFPFTIIVQDCCLETWLLGNASLFRSPAKSSELQRFRAFCDVGREDPERLPKMDGFETRARFHFAYLRRALREHGLSYSKERVGPAVLDPSYFQQLVQRVETRRHLRSLEHLFASWRELGATLAPADGKHRGRFDRGEGRL